MLKIWSMALLLTLAVLSGTAITQPEGDGTAAETNTPSATQKEQPDTSRDKKPAEQDSGDDSPFDYQSSEQISEDLSVSFPVDI